MQSKATHGCLSTPGQSETPSPLPQQWDSFAPVCPGQQLLATGRKILDSHGRGLQCKAADAGMLSTKMQEGKEHKWIL